MIINKKSSYVTYELLSYLFDTRYKLGKTLEAKNIDVFFIYCLQLSKLSLKLEQTLKMCAIYFFMKMKNTQK